MEPDKTKRPVGRPRKSMEQRFWDRVQRTDSCWIWRGFGDNAHRPRITSPGRNGRPIMASRYAYELLVGPIPAGMWVLHTCDNGVCVNPDHLYLGTQVENENDKVSRNRSCRGSKNAGAKLRAEDVRKIRELVAHGRKTGELAEMFGVSKATITAIRCKYLWGWLS